MELSILLASVGSRLSTKMPRVFLDLEHQASRLPVEILALTDNRSMSIGAKRNALMSIARGRFVTFVDDDDRVSRRYVNNLLEAIDGETDVIVFDVWVRGYRRKLGLTDRIARYDVGFEHSTLPSEYRRKPNHLMAWRAEVARRVRYPETSYGEDTSWAETICRELGPSLRQKRIHDVLYFYDFDETDTSMNGSKA